MIDSGPRTADSLVTSPSPIPSGMIPVRRSFRRRSTALNTAWTSGNHTSVPTGSPRPPYAPLYRIVRASCRYLPVSLYSETGRYLHDARTIRYKGAYGGRGDPVGTEVWLPLVQAVFKAVERRRKDLLTGIIPDGMGLGDVTSESAVRGPESIMVSSLSRAPESDGARRAPAAVAARAAEGPGSVGCKRSVGAADLGAHGGA